MIYVYSAIGVAIVFFVWWRYTSVERGARQRDLKLFTELYPIQQRLEERKPVSADEAAKFARKPQYRPMLYTMLKHYEQLELFPPEYLTPVAQGEGVLAYWLMHPNELQAAPTEMQLIEEVTREREGQRLNYFVYRYRMPSGHSAEKDGWRLGLAGPFVDNDVPYSGVPTAFSRPGDTEGKITPTDLVDWWLGFLAQRSA